MFLKVSKKRFAVLPFFPAETDDFMALDVFTQQGWFGANLFPHYDWQRLCQATLSFPHSVSPEASILDLGHP